MQLMTSIPTHGGGDMFMTDEERSKIEKERANDLKKIMDKIKQEYEK